MNSRCFCWVLSFVLLPDILLAPSATAQYAGNFQTNIISGVTSNWSGDYLIGNSNYADILLIQNGGVLSNGFGFIGKGDLSVGSNVVIVSGSGSVWYNNGSLDAGNPGVNNELILTNGGTVYSFGGSAGGSSFGPNNAHNNMVLVTGADSIWSNTGDVMVGGDFSRSNSVTIADGGAVCNSGLFSVGTGQADRNETVRVTGNHSVLSTGSLLLGGAGQNSMVVSNGGVVNSSSSMIYGESPDTVLVTGNGSVWNNGSLVIQGEQGSALTICDGGTVFSSAALIRNPHNSALVTDTGSVWNVQSSLEINVTGCSLTVSNGGTAIAGDVQTLGGSYTTLSDGSLYVTNGLGSGSLQADGAFTFNSGTLATRATTVNNGSVLTVGDSVDAATFIMVDGGSGFHSFANGLTISSNAVLKGVGTIIGDTAVNPGGKLSSGDAPGSITFSNNLTLAPGSIFAVELDGAGGGQYSRLVGLDTLSVSNSILSVTLGYTPSVGDTFTIISNLGPSAVFGTFVDPQGDILANDAIFTVDEATFEISYEGNSDVQDVILTAVIPEPATLLLAALGSVLLWPALNRKRT